MSWIGNSVDVARRHYLQVGECDFDKAIGNLTQNPTQSAPARGCIELPKILEDKEKHWEPSVSPSRRVGVTGIEPDSVTSLHDNDLQKLATMSLPESGPDGVVLPPDVGDRLPESLRASLTASILESGRGDDM